jgi:hypothetical protein
MQSHPYRTTRGTVRYRIEATPCEVEDGTLGACLACGEATSGVEPDARRYTCESCGEPAVYGLEEVLLMGQLELLPDEEEDPC